MKKFKLHWLDGRTEIVTGENIAQAMTLAGYSNGAVKALDYHEEIKDNAPKIKSIDKRTFFLNKQFFANTRQIKKGANKYEIRLVKIN